MLSNSNKIQDSLLIYLLFFIQIISFPVLFVILCHQRKYSPTTAKTQGHYTNLTPFSEKLGLYHSYPCPGNIRYTIEMFMCVCLHRNPNTQALITTGRGKFYSNGLDLNWLMKVASSDPQRLERFYSNIRHFWLRMLKLPIVTVAAINGLLHLRTKFHAFLYHSPSRSSKLHFSLEKLLAA